jgi:hypothetical protein
MIQKPNGLRATVEGERNTTANAGETTLGIGGSTPPGSLAERFRKELPCTSG